METNELFHVLVFILAFFSLSSLIMSISIIHKKIRELDRELEALDRKIEKRTIKNTPHEKVETEF
jgi:cell division protein FtsL